MAKRNWWGLRDMKLCYHQLSNQGDLNDTIRVSGFIRAYLFLKKDALIGKGKGWNYSFYGQKPDSMIKMAYVVSMGVPESRYGNELSRFYRTTPVSFANGSTAMAADQIPRAMENLIQAIEEKRISPDEAFKEFETIHPFQDGNGRVGHLLWAYMKTQETGKWPMELPPNVF